MLRYSFEFINYVQQTCNNAMHDIILFDFVWRGSRIDRAPCQIIHSTDCIITYTVHPTFCWFFQTALPSCLEQLLRWKFISSYLRFYSVVENAGSKNRFELQRDEWQQGCQVAEEKNSLKVHDLEKDGLVYRSFGAVYAMLLVWKFCCDLATLLKRERLR